VHDHLRDRLGSAYRPTEPGATPPAELQAQTSGLRPEDVPGGDESYWAGAHLGALIFLQLYERAGGNIRTCASFLDFGCGTGKLASILQCVSGLELAGTDLNRRLIDWDLVHRPGAFSVNEPEPPLPFGAGTFDLVVAASVFTHIPLSGQHAWLEEIHRVMTPGAVFLCTVNGGYHVGQQLSPETRLVFERAGEVELNPGDEGLSAASVRVGLPDVFQTRSRVLRAFGSVFHVTDYVASDSGQDVLLLRSRQGTPVDRRSPPPGE
jgi:SAM-dependent methyltransferase